ncbi:hypothetical protein B0H13DRAFT_60905 [Mycena leptocephala]|nr:hypothetical protein B0H13DRAFT_60905 [Mycena leptocephala]
MVMLIRPVSGTASLLAHAATNWPMPSVIPPGWSASWKHWDYLLTLLALNPYFLRLPQIVNVKYAIPGQVHPIIFSGARECVLFWTEIPHDPDGPLLDCRTIELYTYDATRAKQAADTVEEIMLLVAAAPSPSDVPMLKLEPDAEGEAALACILERDPSVIPLLESNFLGCALRATEPDEELMSADEAEARHSEKFTQAIRNVEAYVAQTEADLAADAAELTDLLAVGSPELLEQEGLDKDEEAHAKMWVHVEDAKEKFKALRKTWMESYGPWVVA